ncbi:MAG: flagellar basal body rod protein FlgF [Succinimonas sp.]|nr:flagellar basal body rod protein FlgF [Succinimonas sp.]
MDRMLYIAMSGAKENFHGIALHGNNLANASTTAFKADLEQARTINAYGPGFQSRAFSMTERPGYNLESGTLITTGRDLDLAVRGEGYFAVVDRNGEEAYTRNGSLTIDENGLLKTSNGQPLLDDSGNEIILPVPLEKVSINNDGVISGRPAGADLTIVEEFAQIKLVKIPDNLTVKGADGLFRPAQGGAVPFNDDVSVTGGALEASNVNVVQEMTSIISLQRQFDMQIKMMRNAEQNDEAQNSLLRMS